jgi:hypothetical protein
MLITTLTSVLLILSFGKIFEIQAENYIEWVLWAVLAGVYSLVGTVLVFALYSPKGMKRVLERVLRFIKRR